MRLIADRGDHCVSRSGAGDERDVEYAQMRHILFLSYDSKNSKDAQFQGFFKDLCREISLRTQFTAEDERIAFRDRISLPLGEQWGAPLRQALEQSSVLLCLSAPGYYNKSFCGKEFYIFQQRIKKHANAAGYVLPKILPIIWVPEALPSEMNEYVWKHDDLPDEYSEKGLRYLRWIKSVQYKKSLAVLADAILAIWKKREKAIERSSEAAEDFDQIPNAFGGDEWEEAANGQGWIPGPEVANVVYGAGTKQTVPSPKYGELAREWKPYLPPFPHTVAELTRSVVHSQALRYREIPVDNNLDKELELAQRRKNLIVVVADAASLADESSSQLRIYDSLRAEGTALLMPWDECAENPWNRAELQKSIQDIFPVKSITPACYRAPILSVEQMRSTLDRTLVEIRDSLTKLELSSKPANDRAPATVSGTNA